MTIILYRYTGEDNRVDKLSRLEGAYTIDGTLRDSSDVLNPSVLFSVSGLLDIVTHEGDDVFTQEGEDVIIGGNERFIAKKAPLFEVNYAYIREFRRYYFINDMTAVRNGLWMLSMTEDVLMSHKEQIYLLKAFVARNEFASNANVPDPLLPFKPIPEVTETEVTNLSTVTELMPVSNSSESDPVVRITVINDVGYDRNAKNAPENILPTLQNNYLGLCDFAHVYHASMNSLDALVDALNNEEMKEKIDTFITSMVAYPFILPSTSATVNLKVGPNYTISSVGVYEPLQDNPIPDWMLIADFTIPRTFNDWRDYEPYSQYDIYLPYVGYIQLPDELAVGKRLKVYYSIAGDDGSVQIQIICDSKIIYNSVALIGVQIPLNSTNAYEITTNRLRIVSSLVSGITGGIGRSVSSLGAGNDFKMFGGLIQGATQIGESINTSITSFRENRPQGKGSIGGSFAGRYLPQKVRLRVTRKQVLDISMTEYAHEFGRPLNTFNYLSERFGFTVVGDVHLDTLSCMSSEKDRIGALLRTGVILPDLPST